MRSIPIALAVVRWRPWPSPAPHRPLPARLGRRRRPTSCNRRRRRQLQDAHQAAQRAHLGRTLKQPGPYTVFAPTDAAFAKVPQRKLNALLRSRSKLRSVLLYHVAAGELPAAVSSSAPP